MSGYGGMSTTSSKNRSGSTSGFTSSDSVSPEQLYELQRLWAYARGMMDFTSKMYQPAAMQVSQQQNQVFQDAYPAWQNALVGGAYKDFDVNKLTDSIYSSMDEGDRNINQFEKMQTRQRLNLGARTANSERQLNKQSNKQGNQLDRRSNKLINTRFRR